MNLTKEQIFMYVIHAERAKFEELGWVAYELGPPHCFYSVLMEWCGEGDPKYLRDSDERTDSIE